MDTLRLRGDEVQLRVTQNGVLVGTLTAIKSCDIMLKIERKSEGFLGEGTDRHDMQFKGAGATIVFHPESKEPLVLAFAVKQRASRRVAQGSVRINMVFTANFPNGDRPRLSMNDLQFGDIPLSNPGRESYAQMTYDVESDDITLGGV